MAKRGFSGAVMRTFGAEDFIATVVSVEPLTPHFVRIHFQSDPIFETDTFEPASWLRFWFPDITGKDVEHQRGYTIIEGNPSQGEFTIDFVLHEPAGPASHWAQHAQPGMTLPFMTMATTKFELPSELPAGYLLIGDAASLPAITRIVETIPRETAVIIYLEEHAPHDHDIPLPDRENLTIHWVPRVDVSSLAAALESRDWSDWRAWVTPEAGSLKQLRTKLRDEFGFPKSELHMQAYWNEGRAMGKQRGPKPDESPATLDTPATPAAAETDATPEEGEPVSQQTGSTWRAAAGSRLIAPLKPKFITAGVLQGLITLIELAPYFLLVELARLLVTDAPTGRLWELGFWTIGLMIAGSVLSVSLLVWLHYVDAKFERTLRSRLLEKLSRLPLGWFDARSAGQVKHVVQDDTLALHYLVTHAVSDAVQATVAPIAVLVYLFAVDWQIALALFIPVLVYIVTMYVMIVQSGGKTSESMRWTERMNTEATSYLEGQPVIRVFGGSAASTFRKRLDEYIHFLKEWQQPFTKQKTVMDLATKPGTFLVVIALIGTVRVTVGDMDPINLLPFLILGTTFGTRLLGIGYGLGGLRDGLTAARRIQVTLEEPELVIAAPGPSVERQATLFDRVSFEYRPGNPVVNNVSFTLTPGTITALVGPSGAGKSTLAALLARFYDVTDGSISINGRDVRSISQDELYREVSFVFQDATLVHGSVRDNIALAVPDAAQEAVEQAARDAQIHNRIMDLPRGYDTLISADELSGGERQRLAIARAILTDAPILVLDEATAYADPESEFLVQQALNKLTAGRTVLVIAHRLYTVTDADQIVVLEHGGITEQGTHDELMAVHGRYHELWLAGQHASEGATQ